MLSNVRIFKFQFLLSMRKKEEIVANFERKFTLFDPLTLTSSSTMNMGGDTASLVLMIGTMFKLMSSDKVAKRFFRVSSL